MYKSIVTLILTMLAMVWGVSSARAACSTPVVNASFGSVTSFAVNSAVSTSSGSISVNCGSALATVFNTDTISVQLTASTFSSGTQAVMKKVGDSSGDNIPITVCLSAQNCGSPMTIGAPATTFNSSQLSVFLLTGGKNFTIPLFFTTQTGQTVAAGTYTTTLSLATSWNICTGIGVNLGVQVCLLPQSGSTTLFLTVTLVVTNDCTTILAPAVSFGSAPLLSSFSSVTQTISVTCTKGSVYTVGLNDGTHAVNSVRNMASGSSLISYDIYQSTTSNRWGSSVAAQRWSSTNATSISTNQLVRNYDYTATILSGQQTPVAGNYTDTITVDLSF